VNGIVKLEALKRFSFCAFYFVFRKESNIFVSFASNKVVDFASKKVYAELERREK